MEDCVLLIEHWRDSDSLFDIAPPPNGDGVVNEQDLSALLHYWFSDQSGWLDIPQAQYSGGTGEPNDPYQIATAGDLMLLGENPYDYDKHFIMTADIDLDPNLPGRKVFDKAVIAPEMNDERNSFGPLVFDGKPFKGVFYGNGHTISNLTIRGGNYLALFGKLDHGAEVFNLGLEAVDVNGTGTYIGSLVGRNLEAVNVKGTSTYIGSLVGRNDEGSISNCYSTGTVSGDSRIGGLVGENNSGHITTSYSIGEVSGTGWRVGGLVGQNSGIISDSYSSSDVTGDHYVGGLVGLNYDGIISNCYSTGSVPSSGTTSGLGEGNGGLVGLNTGIISNCYSVGSRTIPGRTGGGGLVGSNNGGMVTASFWNITTSGATTSAGGTGIQTALMQVESIFTSVAWDFADIWDICEGTNYPRLQWQIPAGDVVCPDGVSMVDFSLFAEHWLEETCDLGNDYCRGTDLDQSGTVDVADLGIFVENWLAGIAFGAESRPIEFSFLAHWKFDETEGHIAHESVGGIGGIVIGDTLWRPDGGKVDGALELDGIDDIVISNFALNPADGPFSVLAWIKGGAPGQVIICQNDGTGTGSEWLWASPSDGKLMTSLMYPEPPLESEYIITDGDWHKIGLMWDGWLRHLYVDGAVVAKDTDIVDPVPVDGGLCFGAGEDAGSFFSGLIDDILIYEGSYILDK
jgi:hypothetical protein